MSRDFAHGLLVGTLVFGTLAMGINLYWYRYAQQLNNDWSKFCDRVIADWRHSLEEWRKCL